MRIKEQETCLTLQEHDDDDDDKVIPCIRQKTGAQSIVKEIKQYQEKWLQHVQRMDTDYQNKHYNINQKEEETQDDRRRDGGTNFILRIKEQDNMPDPSGT